MAPHSSTLAWKIPWREEPGRLQSMGSRRVGHDAVATGTLSTAERSYPTSEVRGRSREDPMPEGWQPRRVTPRPRSGAAAESARLRRRRNSREEPARVWGQGRRPRGATSCPRPGWRPGGATSHQRSHGCTGTGGPRGAISRWRSGRLVVRRYPSSKVRSSGCAMLEQPWRDTPRPR